MYRTALTFGAVDADGEDETLLRVPLVDARGATGIGETAIAVAVTPPHGWGHWVGASASSRGVGRSTTRAPRRRAGRASEVSDEADWFPYDAVRDVNAVP